VRLGAPFLWPLSLVYGGVSHLRARAYETGILRQRRLEGIVISVGNLTVGGTGKTPMVLWIAQRLLAEGKRVGILTRGYRGEAAGAAAPGSSSASAEGGATSDEVRLLKARLGEQIAFGVGADRFANGQRLAKRGVNWFVLDDGFQHLQLGRDVDIVLIDATNPLGGGKLLPAGRLREPRSALARADIVVITRSDHSPAIEAAVRRDSDAPIFYARPRLDAVRVWRGEHPGEEDADGQSRKLFAFCGIGNPGAFVNDLRQWGLQIVGQRFFPDHHRFTTQDAAQIEAEADAAGAGGVICTEKDIFNLGGASSSSFGVRYCSISMQMDNEGEFWRAIKQKAESRSDLAR
jgi:tetraacyldisaccharide 4'-kinase